jgi:argininosuccinate synthase
MLEDPMTSPIPEMFKMTTDPKDAPNDPARLRIEFTAGTPTKVHNITDGTVHTDPLELFLYLNQIAGMCTFDLVALSDIAIQVPMESDALT